MPALPAVLPTQAGRTGGERLLARQLSVWRDAGFEQYISAPLTDVYRLLAGKLDDVLPGMQVSPCATPVLPPYAATPALPAGASASASPKASRACQPAALPLAPFFLCAAGLAARTGRAPLVRAAAHRQRGAGGGCLPGSSRPR